MTGLIIGLAAFLILIILLLIYRITVLARVMKGEYEQKIGISNKINAALLPISFVLGLIAFWWSYHSTKVNYLPEAASAHGVHTDTLFWWTLALLTVAFVVTNIFLFFFPYLYQHKEGRKAYFYPENHTIELIWTIVPAVTMAILVFFGWKLWADITKPERADAEVIEIMGKQFAWQVRYPGPDGKLGKHYFRNIDETNEFGIDFTDSNSYDDFVPRELHFPKGKQVVLYIRARDVLHSVYLPHFRVKMDAVPGMPTKFVFTPTKSTQDMRNELGVILDKDGKPKVFNFEMGCAEVCGRGHYAMRFIVVVDELEDYEKWKQSQPSWVSQNVDYVAGIIEKAKNNTKVLAKLAAIKALSDTTATATPVNVPATDSSAATAKDSVKVDKKVAMITDKPGSNHKK